MFVLDKSIYMSGEIDLHMQIWNDKSIYMRGKLIYLSIFTKFVLAKRMEIELHR